MVRVVCEFCQTVYNIPESKLARAVSQATCKVCHNKIVIRRDASAMQTDPGSAGPPITAMPPLAADGGGAAGVRQPAPSATAISANPPPAGWDEQEQEISDSWRDAIVDNRTTADLLRKTGVRVPDDRSTAAGPKISFDPDASVAGTDGGATAEGAAAKPPMPMPPPPFGSGPAKTASVQVATNPDYLPPMLALRDSDGRTNEADPAELARAAEQDAQGPGAKAKPAAMKVKAVVTTSPAARDTRGASAPVSLLAGLAALAAAAALWRTGGWASGLTGLAGFAAVAFAASAALLTGILRRRGVLGVLVTLVLAAMLAGGAVGAALATGGERTRALAERLAERIPGLAPLVERLPDGG